MSVQFDGTATYSGGDVVLLKTELGDFAIPKIEFPELAPGEYPGKFCLKRVHVAVYPQEIGTVIMLGAKLDAFSFAERAATASEPVRDTRTDPTASVNVDADRRLFSSLDWPLRNEIKLNPNAVNRQTFRQQCVRLRQLGYQFNSHRQCWYKKAG